MLYWHTVDLKKVSYCIKTFKSRGLYFVPFSNFVVQVLCLLGQNSNDVFYCENGAFPYAKGTYVDVTTTLSF